MQMRLMRVADARLLGQGHPGPGQHSTRHVLLPGTVTALAGLWLVACGAGLGPALVPWLTRWNEALCGSALLIVSVLGWRWPQRAAWACGLVGGWLLLAPSLLRYDEGEVVWSTWTAVLTGAVVILAADRWAAAAARDTSRHR